MNIDFANNGGVCLLAANIRDLSEADYRRLYLSLLSKSEAASLSRFRFDIDRKRHAVGLALRRAGLSRLLQVSHLDIAFGVEAHGKPIVKNLDDLRCQSMRSDPDLATSVGFNISHGGDWVVAVFASSPIGVDIEYTQRSNDILTIAKRYFYAHEYDQLLVAPSHAEERFYDLWTLKEAYMKARGEGIALGLDNFAFILDGAGRYRLHCKESLNDQDENWHFLCSTPIAFHRLAIALRSDKKGNITECSRAVERPARVDMFKLVAQGEFETFDGFSELVFYDK